MTTVPYTFGNESSPIPLSQLDANFAAIPNFANTAGNVTNPIQANITSVGTLTNLSVAGNVRTANISVTGSIISIGDATAGNLFTGGSVSAFGTITGTTVSAVGNVQAANVRSSSTVSAVGNVVGGNIVTAGAVTATGNIQAQGKVIATGNIETAQFFVGNFLGNITGNLSVGGSNTQVLYNLNGNVGAAGGLTYNQDSNVLTVLGEVSAQGNVTADNIISTSGQFSGVVTGPTATAGTSNNQLATTAFVSTTVGTLGTMASQNAVSVAITGGAISNVIMSGLITAPTPANGTSNTQVATTAFVINNGVPSGGIIMWSGSIATIPSGWYLCNGSNGTPDLRDRFIVGSGGGYAVGATGGSANATLVSHTHTANVVDPGHYHISGVPMDYSSIGTSGIPVTFQKTGSSLVGTSPNTYNAQTGISVTNSTEGQSATNANLPPYYALAYIMKA